MNPPNIALSFASQTSNADTLESMTPMMRQYHEIKAAHAGYVLFYRMGDFYELFFDDALLGAQAMDVALTKRGQHQGQDIPMCGVPFHSYEAYAERLIRAGHKVAICEQIETPEEAKKRGGYKAVVRREVVRILTPGTLTEEPLLDAKAPNYLAAYVVNHRQQSGVLAWVDVTSGQFYYRTVAPHHLAEEFARIQPREILISERLSEIKLLQSLVTEYKESITTLTDNMFSASRGIERVRQHYELQNLQMLDQFGEDESAACGVLLEYITLTQKEHPAVALPKREHEADVVLIDAATRRNLELIATLNGERRGSLLATMDRTATNAGSRRLLQWIASPLQNCARITARQDVVAFLLNEPRLLAEVHQALAPIPDIERSLSRILLQRGGPRDLLAVRDALTHALTVAALFLDAESEGETPQLLSAQLQNLSIPDTLLQTLKDALRDEVPYLSRDGGYIREGYDAMLDEWRGVSAHGESAVAALEKALREESGIDRLKIKENNILGMFIEVNPSYANRMPERFIHRQTMANAVRYTTPELRELDAKRMRAGEASIAREVELFIALTDQVRAYQEPLRCVAEALSVIDALVSFARLAQEQSYCRPLLDDSLMLDIRGGRHPVVELSIRKQGQGFIANDCVMMQSDRVWLLTGPNMAGKSTFLRQNALIILMAQLGSYVPAESAHIGIVDRVFSRVGASDDLARGRSTFMVEMMETATILNQSTPRSFVILDEIGRGTSTFDGLSIAWAVLEHLHHQKQCRALFATHYHELTLLKETLNRLACYTMQVKEWKHEIVFLHQVIPGVAAQSYGIHVAKLAGLPRSVIQRAGEVLSLLQKSGHIASLSEAIGALPLFHAQPEESAEVSQPRPNHPILDSLRDISPDDLSAKDALELIYRWKRELESD